MGGVENSYTLCRYTSFWNMTDIKLAWKAWTSGPFYSTFSTLPIFLVWGIWLARNKKLFYDILILAQVYAGCSFGIFKYFPLHIIHKPSRVNIAPIVDNSFPWVFIDGAS